ncbi:hypothetical protein [Leekyejoonella antrihumi]|uniref:Uncharacterized protein n=1 Tax=Leekyejoonella antrihumi TaxID=1660198 RepID=A0A563E0X5_9MICO|nr:hypothetical protein [Leekyejoonella antrihumi]TWP36167.1 hypothetical protein FGL98_10720 [Leekyejoonella antrihumi]
MTPPSIRDIRDDNELLDSLGARRRAKGDDEVAGMLAAWVEEIDEHDQLAPGRYARVRRGGMRVGAASALLVAAMSVSGVAAAMTETNLPVFHQLGQFTHGLVFGTHPLQTTQPAGPTETTTAASWGSSTTSSDSSSATSVPPGSVITTSAGTTYLRVPPVVGTSTRGTSTRSTGTSSSSSSATSPTSRSSSSSSTTASPTSSTPGTSPTSTSTGPTGSPPTPTMTRNPPPSYGPGPAPTATPSKPAPSTSPTSTATSTPPPSIPSTR